MTQDNGLDLAQAYKQINEAEVQADSLEKMLDQLDAKMDSILKEAEGINKINETNETYENNEINSGASD
ncbi:DEHA2B13310p [Debaryomyces hansenii CBS767]|jgi:23S rRNA maturation mini-RNase III|uniref:DEHA2B13310p n=1 Tax=Debaryomyces hansenii (strain ATCC 36239 / CBS 767 / BCRC 21394 / JCM 1990 / NBRC 0083 / IGC 2968) TaxID=284592 RepID=Q6BW95_DEBHA|nr:DEHA2B13310p [Debaryomyces hansenii CBS767]CAG85533.1 DEHA2B13310p [Debaryomyces hansenii CBS767]|eukprot:XP_457524.1 DEHA2B13310p [Debaryomyces hansenii CBS767]